MADERQPIELFTCPHHLGDLRITPTTCVGMWTRAMRSPEEALVRLAPCVGCLSHLQGGAPAPVRHWIELFDSAA